MNKWTARAARTVLVATAFSAIGAGVANADDTSGDYSILGGNQVSVPINVPINVNGNAIGILGRASSGGEGEDDSSSQPCSHHHFIGAPTRSWRLARPMSNNREAGDDNNTWGMSAANTQNAAKTQNTTNGEDTASTLIDEPPVFGAATPGLG